MDSHPQPTINEPIRASIVVLMMRMFVAFILIDTIYFIIRLLFFDLNASFIPRPMELTILILLLLLFYVIQITLITFIVLSWIGVSYFIDEHNIILRRGILHIQENIYPVRDVKAVNVEQGIFGKLLNFGTVSVTIASPPVHEEISLVDVPAPHAVEARIKRFL